MSHIGENKKTIEDMKTNVDQQFGEVRGQLKELRNDGNGKNEKIADQIEAINKTISDIKATNDKQDKEIKNIITVMNEDIGNRITATQNKAKEFSDTATKQFEENKLKLKSQFED